MSAETAARRRSAPRPRGRGDRAERLRARPARARLLAAARELADERGYEGAEAGAITRRAKLSHETFYTHFADKRQCLIEACVPRLTEIDLQVREALLRDDPWAEPLCRALEESLAKHLGGGESVPRRAARAAFRAVAEHGYAAVRIGEIATAAAISKPAFYRHFRGKADCFALGYMDALAALEDELAATPESGLPGLLRRLGERLAADPERATTLVSEVGWLDAEPSPQDDLAWRESLAQLLARLMTGAAGAELDPERLRMAAGAAIEIWRSAAVTGDFGSLGDSFAGIARLLAPGGCARDRPRPRSAQPLIAAA